MRTLYKITADYRPRNPKSPTYYLYADSKKEAKQIFEGVATWLDVYEVVECPNEIAAGMHVLNWGRMKDN